MTLDEAIKTYFDVCTSLRGMSAATVQAYECDFRDFLRFASARGLREAKDVTTAHVNDYLLLLRRRGLKLTTLHRRRNALSSLFTFLVMQGWVGKNPVAAVRLQPRPQTTRDIVLEDEEVRRFLQADISYRTVSNDILDALRMLLVFTGLRCSELLKLDWAHVDLERALLTVYDSKNSARKGLPDLRDRDVPLCRSVLSVLTPLRLKEGPVLVSKRGARLSPDAFQEIVARAAEAANLKRNGGLVTAHGFRHNLASQLALRGYSEADVRLLLGHRPASVTQVYMHSTIERLRSAIQLYDDAITLQKEREERVELAPPVEHSGVSTTDSVDSVYGEARRLWDLVAGGPMSEEFLLGFLLARKAARPGSKEFMLPATENPRVMRSLQG